MRLTPLDIQNHRFSSRMRGIDPAEVESFLHLLSEDYEALLRDRESLATQAQMFGLECENPPPPDLWFEHGQVLEMGALRPYYVALYSNGCQP